MTAPNSFVQVNTATTPGKKLATYEFLDGGDLVESEAVTLTDHDGNELLGQQTMADSIPVTMASDQAPIAVVGTFTATQPTISTRTSVAVALVATTLLTANAARLGAIIWNDGPTPLYVALGAGATTSSFTAKVYGQSYLELPYPAYTGAITAIRAAGAGSARVTELT